MPHSYHIIVENNPAIIYGTRGGAPHKLLPNLKKFLDTFWKERDTFGEYIDTPECLVAQITIRFGYATCEDDFSNIRVGIHYKATADYLYQVGLDRTVTVWVASEAYHDRPELGLAGCILWSDTQCQLSEPIDQSR
ncbi:histidine kinase [Phormidium sp. CLA17]|uniref:histidine kinase n=1 Tax=Leptolyngbya sp. Cla-17 TaxID=2803751 RepID=UPI0014914FB9|nr:histidine kinase [Leptolyngbya sp. Cla-17]MBM0741244.1 histidine kinase [Leptolyngbya sp. Cla-17]